MRYKYQAHLDSIANCPMPHFAPRKAEAYRYVFSDSAEKSFLPVLAKNPNRALNWNDVDRCSGWALSFFTSAATARTLFESLRRLNPRIHKSLGNGIAVGQLSSGDGVSCEAERSGHFELHEYDGTELASKFSLLEALI